ncbi:phospholipase A2-alpha-like isoform X2 [Apium graveolens]|uniref:phospholipase A2-alpha-like isoform X2 n=1 Tax=Apium graveolens TaxID=4045 RepID=UPI003D7A02F5
MTPSKLLLVSFYFIHQLLFFYAPAPAPADALDLGIQADTRLSPGKHCSRTCESSFCSVAPLLRYGKYCGILYGGCPGEKPCDELDACCMKHDACIISKQRNFKKARGTTFRGNTCEAADVIKVITVAMDAALLAVGHHPKP